MITDYLAAEADIVQRLKDQVADVAVLSARDLAGVEERSQPAPALHVLYAGHKVESGQRGSAGRGAARIYIQRWIVFVVVRFANDPTGAGVRGKAGPLMQQADAALAGWAPNADCRELHAVAPMPPAYANGFGYFPLAFETRLTVA